MRDDVTLTPEEVAGILKITKNTVYEMIKRGDLPAFRIGRKLRIDPKDIEIYRQQGKSFEFSKKSEQDDQLAGADIKLMETDPVTEMELKRSSLIICGQDIMLDILGRHLEARINTVRALRYQVGSFSGLWALYHGKADLIGIHLWDGDAQQYNISYVRHLLPGIPAIIIHLAIRTQGFFVTQGNPKNIKDWQDLARADLKMINREKGSGTRVLLDEQLRRLKLDSTQINGYANEEYSHLAVASAVARGEADLGLGNEKAFLQVKGIDFIPLQKERYEMVIKKEDIDKPQFQTVLGIIRSPEFKAELQGLGDYELGEIGQIVAEL